MASIFSTQLLELGVQPGGVLLVHSSLRSLGPQAGGAEAVIAGLREALGPYGTLLLPALSYASVSPDQPIFDQRQTPSCVGALAEYFRTRPGTLRSLHPTHSICGVGPLAGELLAGHELDSTPVGPHSAFARLPGAQGQILFLGCGMGPNTSMHGVEELVLPPYLFGGWSHYILKAADGREVAMPVHNHSFAGYEQRYERVAARLEAPDLRQGQVLQAACHLVEAAALWSAALRALRQDALFFVEASS